MGDRFAAAQSSMVRGLLRWDPSRLRCDNEDFVVDGAERLCSGQLCPRYWLRASDEVRMQVRAYAAADSLVMHEPT